jgi:hypothetical protein
VSELCKLRSGKWELTIRECKPNEAGIQPGETHAGKVYFDGQHFAEYRNRKPWSPRSTPEETKEWATVFGIRLTDQDTRDLQVLECAADDLCVHLNKGFSVDAWSHRQPVQDSKGKPEINKKDHAELREDNFEWAHVIAADNHRNGVSGAPFDVVLFEDDGESGSRKVGILFEPGAEGCHCAVLDVDKLAAGDIAWRSNSWRGDRYEGMIRGAIEQYRQEESQQPRGPDVESKAPQRVKPTAEATKQPEQPVLTLIPESYVPIPKIARLDLGRFSSNLIADWNPWTDSFTYTARLLCEDRPVSVPMAKHDLRSLHVLGDERGLPWLREQLLSRGFRPPNVKDLQQFQELVRVNEALIGRFIKQGHEAVLQKLAEKLDMGGLENEPGQGEQPKESFRQLKQSV